MANGRLISVIIRVKGFFKADQENFSPSPCDCGAWSPAAPWPSGSGCAPCHRQGSRSRCQHRRWAEESAGWLRTFEHVWWVMAAETRQLDIEIPKQAHISLLCRSPHRRTLPIPVPLLIHLKASDSPSFPVRFIFPLASCRHVWLWQLGHTGWGQRTLGFTRSPRWLETSKISPQPPKGTCGNGCEWTKGYCKTLTASSSKGQDSETLTGKSRNCFRKGFDGIFGHYWLKKAIRCLARTSVMDFFQAQRQKWVWSGLDHVTLTQALAHGHAVLLRVEIVAVAGTAPVDEAHAFLLVHVEVPAGHGGATGARLRLQGAHLCEGTARCLIRPLTLMLISKATKWEGHTWAATSA